MLLFSNTYSIEFGLPKYTLVNTASGAILGLWKLTNTQTVASMFCQTRAGKLAILYQLKTKKEIVMKKSLIAIAATVAMSSAAVAADLPSKKAAPVYTPPVLTWTGLYAGVNLGGGWKNNTNAVTALYNPVTAVGAVGTASANNSTGGIVGGGQVGYNYQIGSMFVVGAETDIQGSTINGGQNNNGALVAAALIANPNTIATATGSNNVNWFGTVRGRAGIAVMPTLLVYGTGGFAYGGVSRTGFGGQNVANPTLWYAGSSALQTGWTAGGGVEWKFAPAWSVKGEYLYTDLSGSNQNKLNWGAGINNTNNNTQFSVVRAGLNYNFNDVLPTLAKF